MIVVGPAQQGEPFASKVLSADDHWPFILSCILNASLHFIISNKTNVRRDVLKDNFTSTPPYSFPGKLLALLFHRYTYFGGDMEKGLIMIVSGNDLQSATTIETIVLELAHLHSPDPLFLDWIENANSFHPGTGIK